MTRYILIDSNSGYVWGDTADLDGSARDETPEDAARRLDKNVGGRDAWNHAYTFHHSGRPHGNGYFIYRAAESFPIVADGQSAETIRAVQRDCAYLGFVCVDVATFCPLCGERLPQKPEHSCTR